MEVCLINFNKGEDDEGVFKNSAIFQPTLNVAKPPDTKYRTFNAKCRNVLNYRYMSGALQIFSGVVVSMPLSKVIDGGWGGPTL
jgi:hypothetical protein